MNRRTYLYICRGPRCLLAFALVLIAGCGGPLQGPPAFAQTFGTVDEPCVASTKVAVSHCTAHVYLVNRGGQGLGHATIVVTLKDQAPAASSARTISSVKCGGSIPETPAGAEVDLSCLFDLPIGKAVAAPPILEAIDFTAAAGAGSSSVDISGITAFGLAPLAALLAVITLVTALVRRRAAQSPPRPARPSRSSTESDDSW